MRFFAAWFLFAAFCANAGTQNILVVVVADDFGADSLALSNIHPAASQPPTPTLNALAARGVRLALACAYPVCSPTRSAMLTGRYAFRTGVTDVLATLTQQGIYTNEVTLPELLAPTHRTASFGKWHLGGGTTGPGSVGGGRTSPVRYQMRPVTVSRAAGAGRWR